MTTNLGRGEYLTCVHSRTITICMFSGIANLEFVMTPILGHPLTWSIIFTNPDVGDFLIDINMEVKIKKHWELIDVGISQSFLGSDCICTNIRNRLCPKFVTIPVLSKNIMTWKCVKENLMEQMTDLQDLIFWEHNYSKDF